MQIWWGDYWLEVRDQLESSNLIFSFMTNPYFFLPNLQSPISNL
jgi:hypothetical protein